MTHPALNHRIEKADSPQAPPYALAVPLTPSSIKMSILQLYTQVTRINVMRAQVGSGAHSSRVRTQKEEEIQDTSLRYPLRLCTAAITGHIHQHLCCIQPAGNVQLQLQKASWKGLSAGLLDVPGRFRIGRIHQHLCSP